MAIIYISLGACIGFCGAAAKWELNIKERA